MAPKFKNVSDSDVLIGVKTTAKLTQDLPVEVLRRVTLRARRHAKRLSPKDTGLNAKSIGFRKVFLADARFKSGKGKNVGYAMFTRSGYGLYLEMGTYKMAARPYMRPAILLAKKEMQKDIDDALKRVRLDKEENGNRRR
jgi:hypothetical protein